MTFAKSNKSGQSIFEYFVLTAITVGLFLVFMKSQNFLGIKAAAENFFDSAVTEVLK
jgi:hypothetical protein